MPLYQSTGDVVVYLDGAQVLRRKGSEAPAQLVKLDPGFSATEIALNKTGSLLAVAARKALNIWITDGDVPAQRLRIDGLQFDDYIRSIAWHPCAREDACLVVLTQRSIVSLYCPPGETPVVETTRLLDAENIDLDAAGMSFGSSDSPVGPLTLYVATTDGDIYGICPFAPPEAEVPTSRLSYMREFTSLGTWPVELESWSHRHGKVTILKRPSQEALPSRISSEPLKLVPYPDELYNEEVLDLSVGDLGENWASDLVVQTTTHFVNFFISGFPTNNELVLVSCVKFSRPQKVRKVRLVTNKLIIIDTQSETHVLHIDEWLQELVNMRHQHALSPTSMPKVPSTLPPTQVESTPLSYAYRTHKAVETLPVSSNLPPKSWPLRSGGEDIVTDSLQNLTLDSSSYVRPAEPQWKALTNMKVTPSTEPAASLDGNLAALYALDDVSQSYETKISALLKALLQVQFDRQSQKKELLAQLEQASGISRQIDNVDKKAAELPKAVAAAVERQEQLNERIRTITSTVSQMEQKNSVERPPSAAEEAWFDELEMQLSKRTTRAEKQFDDLQKSVSNLKTLRDTQNSSSDSSQKLTHAQLRNIRSHLQRQESLITSLKTSLSLDQH